MANRTYAVPASVQRECARALEQQAYTQRGSNPRAVAMATALASGRPVDAATMVQLALAHETFDRILTTPAPRSKAPTKLRVSLQNVDTVAELSGIEADVLFYGVDPDAPEATLTAGATFTPPPAVQVEAARALDLYSTNKYELSATMQIRARRLADGVPMTRATLEKMHNYFSSHQVLTSKVETDSDLVYLAWGGNPAREWVNSIMLGGDREVELDGWTEGDGYPGSARINYGLFGGDPARKWALTVVATSKLSMTAAAVIDEDEAVEATGEEILDDINIHPYTPGDDDVCDICGEDAFAMVHLIDLFEGEDAIDFEEDEQKVAIRAALATPEDYLPGVKFFPDEIMKDNEVEFFLLVKDPTQADSDVVPDVLERPEFIESILLTVTKPEEKDSPVGEPLWMRWNPTGQAWANYSVPAYDIIPVDDDSAYEGALLLHQNNNKPFHVRELNPSEWAMLDEAWDEVVEETEELQDEGVVEFFVEMGLDANNAFVVKELYAHIFKPEELCLRWDWAKVEWVEVPCPGPGKEFGTGKNLKIDLDAARTLGQHLSQQHQRQQTGWSKETGLPLNKPSGPFRNSPSNKNQGGKFEYDNAFSRAFWIFGTPGPAVTAAGEYTPEERSQNASKQVRDGLGRFASVGSTVRTADGKIAQVISVDASTGRVKIRYGNGSEREVFARDVEKLKEGEAAQMQKRLDLKGIQAQPRAVATTPKAMLDKLLQPMSAAALHAVVKNYQAFIEAERRRKLKSFAAMNPENSDVPPIYLAVVDEFDKSAVMELLALAPATSEGSAPTVFIRQAEGWVQSNEMYQKLMSTNPPSVVKLDDETYPGVLEQVDSFYTKQTPKTASIFVGSARELFYNTYGELLPQIAAGIPGVADTPGELRDAARLRRYWSHGPGAAKIRWGTPGDWYRCVRLLSKHMGPRAKGYCQLRHKDALGFYTGEHHKSVVSGGSVQYLRIPTQVFASVDEIGEFDPNSTVLASVRETSLIDGMTLPTLEDGDLLLPGRRMLVGGDSAGPITMTVLALDDVSGWGAKDAVLLQTDRGLALMIDEEETANV